MTQEQLARLRTYYHSLRGQESLLQSIAASKGKKAYIAGCRKSVIIIAGSAIEAILLDRLQQDPAKARAVTRAPRESDLTRWDLADLIDVAVELKIVSPAIEQLSHAVRQYRNLVHPGNEIRSKLAFGKEEARIV